MTTNGESLDAPTVCSVVGLLAYLLVRGIKSSMDETDAHLRRHQDDRTRAPLDPNFEQLSGRKCRACKDSIIAQSDGMRCESCEKPVHRKCHDRHLPACVSAKTAYR